MSKKNRYGVKLSTREEPILARWKSAEEGGYWLCPEPKCGFRLATLKRNEAGEMRLFLPSEYVCPGGNYYEVPVKRREWMSNSQKNIVARSYANSEIRPEDLHRYSEIAESRHPDMWAEVVPKASVRDKQDTGMGSPSPETHVLRGFRLRTDESPAKKEVAGREKDIVRGDQSIQIIEEMLPIVIECCGRHKKCLEYVVINTMASTLVKTV